MPEIRPANADEATEISALALRSKAHWSYSEEQLDVFRSELTMSPDELHDGRAHVIICEGRVMGFYTLGPIDSKPDSKPERSIELRHLFIDPESLHRGLGTALFRHAVEAARALGYESLVIQSDPNAAGFYLAVGAKLEREIPSSIPGRAIPLFTLPLSNSQIRNE